MLWGFPVQSNIVSSRYREYFLQDILLLFYTNPTNESTQRSVVEDNRDDFKTKHKLLSVSEALVKDIKDLFKDGVSSVIFKGTDKK